MNAKNKDRTPDILGSVMGETIKQESGTAIKYEYAKESSTSASNNYCKPESNKTKNVSKEKTTFNLSMETLEKLEDSWIKLRRQFRSEQRISKTFIVEYAIELVLKDYKQHNESSELFKYLKNKSPRE